MGGRAEPDELGDDEWVSQRVYREGGELVVWDEPRPQDRGELSVIRGRVTPAEALRQVRRRSVRPTGDDGVRYALVSGLRGVGFVVEPKPTNRNPDHTSVRRQSEWDPDAADEFSRCFTPILWHDTDEEGRTDDTHSP